MQKFKINSFLIVSLLLLALIINISAESTFFDDSDDIFIMYDITATSTADSLVTGSAVSEIAEGGCLTNWSCSSWSSCADGMQIRNCAKEKAYCYADLKEKPAESQSCSNEDGKSDETQNYPSKEKLFNWSYVLFFVMIALFCVSCIWILRRRKKIKHLIKRLFEKNGQQNNNNIKRLINKKVYTDNGDYIGKIKEVILEKNRVHSIKIELDNLHELKIKGIILGYRHIIGLGDIILIDNRSIETIRDN